MVCFVPKIKIIELEEAAKEREKDNKDKQEKEKEEKEKEEIEEDRHHRRRRYEDDRRRYEDDRRRYEDDRRRYEDDRRRRRDYRPRHQNREMVCFCCYFSETKITYFFCFFVMFEKDSWRESVYGAPREVIAEDRDSYRRR